MKHALGKLGISAFGALIGLALVELALRLVLGYSSIQEPSALYLHDELLGWRLKPRASAVHSNLAFRTIYQISSQGLRDNEFSYEKPPGTFRILILGDSFTQGFGVALEESYGKRLEALLRERGHRAEVINGGVSGYSTDQQLLFLKRDGSRFRPDLVVVGFFDGDEKNASMVIMGPRRYYKPYFVVGPTGLALRGVPVPVADDGAVRRDRLEPAKRMLRHLAVYAWLQWHVNHSPFAGLLRAVGVTKSVEPIQSARSSLDAADPWKVEELVLAEMLREVRAAGGSLMVALIGTNEHDVDRLSALCLRLEIPFLDIERAPQFAGVPSSRIRIPYDGHWNELGHQLAAEVLRDHIEPQLVRR